MDLLQIALIFFIFLLTILLSILGVQVFFILRDLKKSLDKLDQVLDESGEVLEDVKVPAKAAARVVQAVESGVKVIKEVAKTSKPGRRLFRR